MARFKVLVSAPYFLPVVERFRGRFESADCELVVADVEERLSEADLLPIIGDIDGALCGDDRFSEPVLRAAKKLKVISKWGTGIDSIDGQAAAALGIAVRNTLNAFTEPVADTTMGYILCFARNLPWMDREVKAGAWTKIPGVSLRECTLGVIGVGNIGKAVVRRAQAFGMTLLGNDIVDIDGDFLKATGLQMVDKPSLLAGADFVSLHCDLNPTSYHIISTPELEAMKPTARLLNTARGPLVDEPALVSALQQGHIRGAALDVYEDEPVPDDSPLRTLDQVMLAPHNSNSSPAAWERVHESTVQHLLEELDRDG